MKQHNTRHKPITDGLAAAAAPLAAAPAPRRAATLTEVLVSILVMSIGVVSLMSLFPISVLRSVEATKLTNAAILKENVAGLNQSLPHLPSGAPEWRPGHFYRQADVIVPNISKVPGHFVDAVRGRFYVCVTSGFSGQVEPSWNTFGLNNPVPDNTAVWRLLSRTNRYIVDPMGWALENQTVPGAPRPVMPVGTLSGYRGGNFAFMFGRMDPAVTPSLGGDLFPFALRLHGYLPVNWNGLGAPPPAYGSPAMGPLPSYDASTEFNAQLLATLPDSYKLRTDGFIEPGTHNITASAESFVITESALEADLTAGNSRIILTDFTNRRSETRVITAIDIPTGTVGWNVALPADFAATLNGLGGTARVETFDRRYTWMLTVRRSNKNDAHVNVVVSFRRPGVADVEEQIYPVVDLEDSFDNTADTPAPGRGGFRRWKLIDGAPGIANFDDNGDGAQDDAGELGLGPNVPGDGTDMPNRTIKLLHPDGTPEPSLNAGNYILDVAGMRWYRIQDVKNDFPGITTGSGLGTVYEILLDRELTPSYFRTGQGGPIANGHGAAIVMPSVVEVFPLGTVPANESPND